jgi:WD40 repeat protein
MNKTSISAAKPTYEIELNEKIICFESSLPAIHGESLLLVALKRKIIVFALDISAEDYAFEYKRVKEIAESETKILKLCSQVFARNIIFASCSNYSIKVFSINDSNADTSCLKEIRAHSNYINSIDFSEDYIASGSDDHTCKIFSVKENYEQHSVLHFSVSLNFLLLPKISLVLFSCNLGICDLCQI